MLYDESRAEINPEIPPYIKAFQIAEKVEALKGSEIRPMVNLSDPLIFAKLGEMYTEDPTSLQTLLEIPQVTFRFYCSPIALDTSDTSPYKSNLPVPLSYFGIELTD